MPKYSILVLANIYFVLKMSEVRVERYLLEAKEDKNNIFAKNMKINT